MLFPVKGVDVLFQMLQGGFYYNYACATSVEIAFTMETKSTKTIGDGTWKRKRGQSHDYEINLEGVIIISETQPDVFNMLDYWSDMVEVSYRIIFTDSEGGFQLIEGNALPTNVSLSGPSEGHAAGSITLQGNGEPSIRTSLEMCPAAIATGHYFKTGTGPGVHKFSVDTLHPGSGTITRYDYSVDGGGVQTIFTDGTLPATWSILVSGVPLSNHTIRVVPICENGFEGDAYNHNFVKE